MSSTGKIWSTYWQDNNLQARFGERLKHPHVYPEWFSQSKVNPVECWIYPVEALGEFRIWLYRAYIPEKFPQYIKSKVKQDVLPPSQAELLLESVSARASLPAKG